MLDSSAFIVNMSTSLNDLVYEAYAGQPRKELVHLIVPERNFNDTIFDVMLLRISEWTLNWLQHVHAAMHQPLQTSPRYMLQDTLDQTMHGKAYAVSEVLLESGHAEPVMQSCADKLKASQMIIKLTSNSQCKIDHRQQLLATSKI